MTAPETIAERHRQLRACLGITQSEMAARLRIGLRTYASYESGERLPLAETLAALGQMGFNIHWLITGEGQMRPGGVGASATASPAALDADLYGQVTEAVAAAYKECGYTMALRDIAAEAAKIAADLSEDVLPEDRPAAIRGAIGQLRRRLREALANPHGAEASTQKA
ncbi:MAG: helix-turn-helix transcriptional regulator [Phaeospirillum sp.]|nr:helix-turn-helix transcriptional regulator [Phaeospirillum sp.]